MDQLQTRLDALEQRTHTVERQLRWWRGLACGLVGLAVLAWMLPSGIAQEDAADKGQRGLAQRVAALESLLKHVSREGKEIFITGANLHLVNGLGSTTCTNEQFEPIPDCPNGLGNLIVGYNEIGEFRENIRTGSHNVVVGSENDFSCFGGIIVGLANTISGDFASVSGAFQNTASGNFAVVSGGIGNTASGAVAVVSGGNGNTASGHGAVVSGGGLNPDVPPGEGGAGNVASGDFAVVSGGQGNTASGVRSVVSGGQNRTAEGEFDWVAGSLVEDD
jgi:hypothetical protein